MEVKMMPQKGQKCVTIPEDIYLKMKEKVDGGEERSVAGTVIKAVEQYLNQKDTMAKDIQLIKQRLEIKN